MGVTLKILYPFIKVYNFVKGQRIIQIFFSINLIVWSPQMNAHAVESNLIINVDHRKTISLNGQWDCIIDPYDTGYYSYRYELNSEGYFKNAKPATKSDRVEYDFDASGQLNVPGDWNSQREQLLFYEGTLWYRKLFDYPNNPDARLYVYFGAANYHAVVYLNGERIGKHEGGFTPFNFEITGIVKDKDNFLIVKVDNTRRREYVPTLNTDWWNYGGLTRRVMLVEIPRSFIHDYSIQLTKGSLNELSGWVKLDGTRRVQKVSVAIPDAGVEQTANTNSLGYAEIKMKADLELWSPEKPRLYDVVISCETDELYDRIGFRSIETRGTDILLNGKPVFLRGVCIHEEAPLGARRACTEEDAEILLEWAKELNCNFVRLAHYPHNEYMTRLADRMGIMVWSEIPVYWAISWDNPATFESAKNQLTEMISRDKNKASVILWSLANETPVTDNRMSFLKRLAVHARSLDNTRLLTAAMEKRYEDDTTVIIDDPLGESLDVLGCNEYVGWYEGTPEKCDRMVWKTVYEKPLIMSEFGGGALYGYHGDTETVWTEEFQENLYRHQKIMLKSIPSLRGTTPWILKDFRSPRRPLPRIQDFWNRKGLISDHGQKKKAFFVIREFYNELEEKW